jgi:hypothetical protein
LEEHVSSIFRVAEEAKQETRVEAGGMLSWQMELFSRVHLVPEVIYSR